MLNDPLFIKTQNDLREWRTNRKSPHVHIPETIKDNIRKLNLQYSKTALRSRLDLGGSSLNFLSESKPQIKELPKNNANFIEIPSKPIVPIKEKVVSRIELDLPMGITLRIYQ
jgi:hypothetical protein